MENSEEIPIDEIKKCAKTVKDKNILISLNLTGSMANKHIDPALYSLIESFIEEITVLVSRLYDWAIANEEIGNRALSKTELEDLRTLIYHIDTAFSRLADSYYNANARTNMFLSVPNLFVTNTLDNMYVNIQTLRGIVA